jgi:predicted GIY-YIG superfamily endonuclease
MKNASSELNMLITSLDDIEKRNFKIENNNAIYNIFNELTGEYYIGATTNINGRIISHINNLEKNKHVNKKLQESYNKNEKLHLLHIPIDTKQAAFFIEKELIKATRGKLECLNLRGSVDRTKEHIENNRKSLLEYHKNNKISEETLKKQAIAREQRLDKFPDINQRISNSLKEKYIDGYISPIVGLKHTPEQVEANRQRAIKQFENPEARKLISDLHKGRKDSEETKELKRIASTGRKHNDKTKTKLSENNSKEVIVDNKKYKSQGAVSKELGLSEACVNKRLNNPNFPNWSRI